MLIRGNSIPMRATTTAPVTPRNEQSYQGYADIVIIGNRIAGLTAAIEARRLAPAGRAAPGAGRPVKASFAMHPGLLGLAGDSGLRLATAHEELKTLA